MVCVNDCLQRARLGDGVATRNLVEALQPRLRRMAAYYARCSGEDPDDLLQEAWVGLLDALPRVDLSIGSPEQFLLQRARWRMLDAIKRARVRRCDPLDESSPDPRTAGTPDHVVAARAVDAFTGDLKPAQRAVLALLLAGCTWREAGDRLGCSSANVAYHVRRIKERYVEWAGGGP